MIILVSKWGGGLFRRSSNRISRARASCSFASASSTSSSRAVSCKLPRTIRTFLPWSSLWGSWKKSERHQYSSVLQKFHVSARFLEDYNFKRLPVCPHLNQFKTSPWISILTSYVLLLTRPLGVFMQLHRAHGRRSERRERWIGRKRPHVAPQPCAVPPVVWTGDEKGVAIISQILIYKTQIRVWL